MAGLNGHTVAQAVTRPHDRDVVRDRLDGALAVMSHALILSGFTEYEAGIVGLATRSAITGIIKERPKGQ
jgi:hypothetical protein